MTKNISKIVIDERIGMHFSPIPAGEFLMGSPDTEKERQVTEGPRHRVSIKTFHMAQCEVTQEQYAQIMGENPSYLPGKNCPVDGVTWEDVQRFIEKLNVLHNTVYRLPTEAEWEYCCRANTESRFSFGNHINIDQANYGAKVQMKNCPVGIHPINSFGLFDMHGNVFEWCEDTWHDSYDGAPTDGSAWVDDSTEHKVYRGGAWNASAHFLRSAYRFHRPKTAAYYNIGFRLAF